ncbi:immunoglobulin I-set domain protein [Ancylostoma duodenale]|uniref:Immunoglobulin I-set domain protein n=1 Tax=Ancylostoma duodenale TaxID=51022 RepID=A0A0C2GMG5_9BILA|nr:immunoglobulin I-set domain protein [Ancylostoma duodenale]
MTMYTHFLAENPLNLSVNTGVDSCETRTNTLSPVANATLNTGKDVQITVYPVEAQVREGRDVVFDCRARTADNSFYPPTRWTRVGGPLPPHAHDSSGRLTINPVSLSDSGQYVCTASHNGRTVEARATLHVQSCGY